MKTKRDWLAGSPYARIPLQLLLDKRLGYRHVVVFSALALHADVHGNAHPSQSRIAEMCGWTVSGQPDRWQVSKLIAHLVEAGYVEITHRSYNGANRYRLCVPDCDPAALRVVSDRQEAAYEEKKATEGLDDDAYIDADGALFLVHDCQVAIEDYLDTGFKTVPEAALAHFGLRYPRIEI